ARDLLLSLILRRAVPPGLEGCGIQIGFSRFGHKTFRNRPRAISVGTRAVTLCGPFRGRFRLAERTLAIPMPRPCGLLAAARLTWSARASHWPLRSRRSLAQYSRRFLISRSKPRSGGS